MMAQTIVTLCDAHEDDEHRGSPVLVSLDGTHFLVVDMCQAARQELVEPLQALLAEHGRVVPPNELDVLRRQTGRGRAPKIAANERRQQCPKCLGTMARSGLRKHLENEHGTTLPVVEAELGHTLDGDELKAWCDGCGGGFSNNTGLSAHHRSGNCPGRRLTALPGTGGAADDAKPARKSPAKRASKRAAAK